MALTGFGLGLRPPHYVEAAQGRLRVDFVEIISENFMGEGGPPRRVLEQVRGHYPVAMHGVSLSIGGAEPELDAGYLKRLGRLAAWLEPALVSDHLCWVTHRGRSSHDLLPAAYTRETLELVCRKVGRVQDLLGRPLTLENPSAYVRLEGAELSEAEWLRELCRRSGCGVLLDINNLYVNWRNLGIDPRPYFERLPREAVHQFHLAGHSVQGGVLVDTHDHPVSEPVWELYGEAVRAWPTAPTLVEWDDRIPEVGVLVAEVGRARQAHAAAVGAGPGPARARAAFPEGLPAAGPTRDAREAGPAHDVREVYAGFFGLVTAPVDVAAAAELALVSPDSPVPSKDGVLVYQNGYFLRIISVLKEVFAALHHVMEDEGFEAIVSDYLVRFPPDGYSITLAGARLAEYLRTRPLPYDFGVPGDLLAALAEVEWAKASVFDRADPPAQLTAAELRGLAAERWAGARFGFIPALEVVRLGWDVGPALAAAEAGEAPEVPAREESWFVVHRARAQAAHRRLAPGEGRLLEALRAGRALEDALAAAGVAPPEGVGYLGAWVAEGLVAELRTSGAR